MRPLILGCPRMLCCAPSMKVTRPRPRRARILSGTRELAIMLEQKKPLVIDAAGAWGNSLPGAVGLRGVGVGGSTTDAYQDRLGNKMRLLTRGDTAAPIVVLGWNAERFPARNVALRLVALGYTDVYWYRGGREAWEAAGQSETELIVQDW